METRESFLLLCANKWCEFEREKVFPFSLSLIRRLFLPYKSRRWKNNNERMKIYFGFVAQKRSFHVVVFVFFRSLGGGINIRLRSCHVVVWFRGSRLQLQNHCCSQLHSSLRRWRCKWKLRICCVRSPAPRSSSSARNEWSGNGDWFSSFRYGFDKELFDWNGISREESQAECSIGAVCVLLPLRSLVTSIGTTIVLTFHFSFSFFDLIGAFPIVELVAVCYHYPEKKTKSKRTTRQRQSGFDDWNRGDWRGVSVITYRPSDGSLFGSLGTELPM